MLFIELFAPQGALNEEQRRRLSGRLVTEVVNAPDALTGAIERGRALSQAVVHEPDAWSVGGREADPTDAPRYVVRVNMPARHLTDGMRAELVARVTRVLSEFEEDPQRLYWEPRVWVYLIDIPDVVVSVCAGVAIHHRHYLDTCPAGRTVWVTCQYWVKRRNLRRLPTSHYFYC